MQSHLSTNSGLMLALDIQDASEAEKIVASNKDFIDAIKIGTTLLLSPTGGMEVISNLKHKFKLPLLIDSKLKDVPHILLLTAKSYIAHGATAITCWADVGPNALKLLIKNLQNKIEIIVLTALTSLPYSKIENTAKKNILMAVECGCTGVQIPGNYPELIKWAREKIPTNVQILSCGVGSQGGIVGEAIRCGANYEIIGRKILDSTDDQSMREKFHDSYKIIHSMINEYNSQR